MRSIKLYNKYSAIRNYFNNKIQIMGNCSTEQQQVVIPEEPAIVQTEITKPEATTFVLPTNIHEQKQTYKDVENVLSKTTKMSIIQQSPQQLALKNLKPNTLFVDMIFKTQKKSIGEKFTLEHLEWKRPAQIVRDDPVFFDEQIQHYELKQGRLQNSYFISSLSVLSYPMQRFKQIMMGNVFQNKNDVSTNGAYTLWLFIDGYWKRIIIDDQIPTVNGNYVFCNHKKQIWIWLLEKAYAKAFKSYENIQKGHLGYILTSYTGAPTQYFNTKSSEVKDPEVAWEFVRSNMSHGYMMAASTQNNDRNQYFDRQPTFSYTILDSQQVYILTSTKKKRERILKLDNPWGRYEWKGRWSEYSDVWSQQLRHQLDYEKADDSIMWINIEDLLKNFGQICVSKYIPENINTSVTVKYKQTTDVQVKGLYLNIKNRTEGYLNLIQKDYRNYFKNYKYSMCRLILLQMDKQTNKPKAILAQKMDMDYYCTIPIQLNPGIYYVIVQMDWSCSFTREVVLNVYADQSVNLVQDPNMPNSQSLFYQLALLDQATGKNVQVYTYPHDKNIKRITGVFGGYVYYHYINNSTENKYLSETVELGNSKNIVVSGEKNPQNYAIKLLPGQQKLIRMKITKDGAGDYSLKPTIKNQVFQKYTNESLLEMIRKKPTKVRQREVQQEKINVFVKTFQYSGGVALLYENKMDKYSFIEEIQFDISNLRLDVEQMEQDKKYHLELQPHGQKMLSFLMIDPSKPYKFKTKVQYYLGTPEFQF